jgi:hypothetical protein
MLLSIAIKKSEHMENVRRTLNNFARVPSWNTTMNKEEVNHLFEAYSDTVFCNGMLRQIKADAMTSDVFKVYTVRID